MLYATLADAGNAPSKVNIILSPDKFTAVIPRVIVPLLISHPTCGICKLRFLISVTVVPVEALAATKV